MTEPNLAKLCRRASRPPRVCAVLVLLLGLGRADTVHADASSLVSSVRNRVASLQRDWRGTLWHLSLFDARKPAGSKRSTLSDDGVSFSRPFGERGPELRLSPSMPSATARCLNDATGLNGVRADDPVEAFVILQQRW